VTFSVGLPAKINNLVLASQARFQHIRAIERFCVESSNKRSDRLGHSSCDLAFFIDRTLRASTSSLPALRKLIKRFSIFFHATVGEGAHTWISLGPRIS